MPTAVLPTIAPLRPADPLAELADLFTSQHERLVRLARGIVLCAHAAEDVVQDAMLSATRALERFEGRAATATWLHRIVVNAALMHLRRGRTRRESGSDALDETLESPCEDPALVVERRDAAAKVERCLRALPPMQRDVIELRDVRGLDTAEVAASLGISENAAKIRLHRARRRLREEACLAG